MSAADWATLVPAIVGVLGSLAAWLNARAAHARISAQEQKQKPNA